MSDYDLRDPDFLRQPGPVLARMRAEGDLVRAHIPLMGKVWLTTTDAAARELLKDRERFTRNPGRINAKRAKRIFWWMPPFMKPLMKNIILMDGADHKRVRHLVDTAFARSQIEALRPEIARIADELLDQIDPDHPVEIMQAYTRALPLLVICALLGVPEADRAKITRWISPISGTTGVRTLFLGLPGLWRTMRHFRADFERIKTTPRPGLIGELVAAEEGGDRLDEDELLSLVFTLFVAGHETTVHLITNAIAAMVELPELRQTYREDPEGRALAIEEFMRFFSPVMLTKGHFALNDLTFGGREIKRGDVLCALLIGANHDPARFDQPEQMNLARRPNAHVGFGFGPHVCLGMQLARAEAEIALDRLLARYPDLALANTMRRPEKARRIGINGLKRLDLRLRP